MMIGKYKEENDYFFVVTETAWKKKPLEAAKFLDAFDMLSEKAEVTAELMVVLCKENLRQAAIKQIAKDGKKKLGGYKEAPVAAAGPSSSPSSSSSSSTAPSYATASSLNAFASSLTPALINEYTNGKLGSKSLPFLQKDGSPARNLAAHESPGAAAILFSHDEGMVAELNDVFEYTFGKGIMKAAEEAREERRKRENK